MFPKVFGLVLLVVSAGAMAGPGTTQDGKWAADGTTLFHDRYRAQVKQASGLPPHANAKLTLVLGTADRLFDEYAIYPHEAGHPSDGMGGEPIDWSGASGPELRIEKDLPEGHYTVLLFSKAKNGATTMNLWIDEKLPVAGRTELKVTPKDLAQTHAVKVFDAQGNPVDKSPGRVALESPFFADGWAHGFSFFADSSFILHTNQVPGSWAVLFQSRWETTDRQVLGNERYTFSKGSSDLEVGKNGYTAVEFLPNLPSPQDPYLRCTGLDIALGGGNLITNIGATKKNKVLVARSLTLAQSSLRFTYTTEPFAPTDPDFACLGDIWTKKIVAAMMSFSDQFDVVLASDGKPFFSLPSPMRLGSSMPIPVGKDILGYYAHTDGTVYAQFMLSNTSRQYGEFEYVKAHYQLFSVDDNKVLSEGDSADSGSGAGKWWLGAWLKPGKFRLTRALGKTDASPAVQLSGEFEIHPGGVDANKRIFPSLARMSWRGCCGTTEFFIEPAKDETHTMPKSIQLKVRTAGVGVWANIPVKELESAPGVFVGTFPSGVGAYDVQLTMENEFGDRRELDLNGFSPE
jgi:hypothetical protein